MDLSTLYSMAERVVDERGYSYVWSVVITGLSVVFLGLIILIIFVWLMGKIFTSIQKSQDKKNNASIEENVTPANTVSASAPEPVKAVSNNSDSDEIIAVISAAVAAMGQADGKTYRVRSIKAAKNRSARSAWSMAGLQSDTMPF